MINMFFVGILHWIRYLYWRYDKSKKYNKIQASESGPGFNVSGCFILGAECGSVRSARFVICSKFILLRPDFNFTRYFRDFIRHRKKYQPLFTETSQ